MKSFLIIRPCKDKHDHDERIAGLIHESEHTHEYRHVNEVSHESCHFDCSTATEVIKSPRWTVQQLEDATATMPFPHGTTAWDKYVAFNSFYDDLRCIFTEEQIIHGAYKYFFDDTDAPECKIWLYMKAMKKI